MRSPRLVFALLALALTASLSFTASSASARVETRPALTPASAKAASCVTSSGLKMCSNVLKKRVRPNGPRKLVFQGSVTPARGPVYIQRATKCSKAAQSCNFKFYRKAFLKKGRYQVVINAPRTLRGFVWRAKVRNSYSTLWVTCTKRPGQTCQAPF